MKITIEWLKEIGVCEKAQKEFCNQKLKRSKKILDKLYTYNPDWYVWLLGCLQKKDWGKIVDLNMQDRLGWTPLIYATIYCNIKVVHDIINAGADLNIQDKAGQTALLYAVGYNYIEIVNELIDAGADVNIKNKMGYTALKYAQKLRYTNITKKISKI